MKKGLSVKDMVLCALFAAICCVGSIITVPTGIVPVTLGTFGIMVTAMILGTKRGIISVVLFIILGAIGLPVFSNMAGGIGVLAGPTGGYIYSYILMVPIIGLASKCLNKTLSSGMFTFLGCLAALAVCYIVGTAHFMVVMNYVNDKPYSLWAALGTCVFQFIPFDIAKAIIAIIIAPRLKPLCE